MMPVWEVCRANKENHPAVNPGLFRNFRSAISNLAEAYAYSSLASPSTPQQIVSIHTAER